MKRLYMLPNVRALQPCPCAPLSITSNDNILVQLSDKLSSSAFLLQVEYFDIVPKCFAVAIKYSEPLAK